MALRQRSRRWHCGRGVGDGIAVEEQEMALRQRSRRWLCGRGVGDGCAVEEQEMIILCSLNFITSKPYLKIHFHCFILSYHTLKLSFLAFYNHSQQQQWLPLKLVQYKMTAKLKITWTSHSINRSYMGEGATRDIGLRKYWIIHPSQPQPKQQNSRDKNKQSATAKGHRWKTD